MNIANALPIQGWMDERELVWLATEASKHKRIVEVGSWMGRSTMALADNTEGIVFAVDTWRGSEEHQSALADKPYDWLYKEFCKNLEAHIASGRVAPIWQPSTVAAAAFNRGAPVDMVFIDASHDYESVKADISVWRPHIRPGGIICGHDRGYPPVNKAVQECFGPPGGETDIWVVVL